MDTTQRMKTVLDGLGIDFRSFTMERFIAFLEKRKKRKIFLFAGPMPAGIDGAWFTDAELPHEYIFFDESAVRLRQQHIQLHELSHFLCGHPTLSVTNDNLNAFIFALQMGSMPDLLFKLAQFRTQGKKDKWEEEAETLALLIGSKVCWQG